MHVVGATSVVIIGIYTVLFARTLWSRGNRAGAIWTGVLAVLSVAVTLLYYYQHGFYP